MSCHENLSTIKYARLGAKSLSTPENSTLSPDQLDSVHRWPRHLFNPLRFSAGIAAALAKIRGETNCGKPSAFRVDLWGGLGPAGYRLHLRRLRATGDDGHGGSPYLGVCPRHRFRQRILGASRPASAPGDGHGSAAGPRKGKPRRLPFIVRHGIEHFRDRWGLFLEHVGLGRGSGTGAGPDRTGFPGRFRSDAAACPEGRGDHAWRGLISVIPKGLFGR